jgi:hypothetical protein
MNCDDLENTHANTESSLKVSRYRNVNAFDHIDKRMGLFAQCYACSHCSLTYAEKDINQRCIDKTRARLR